MKSAASRVRLAAALLIVAFAVSVGGTSTLWGQDLADSDPPTGTTTPVDLVAIPLTGDAQINLDGRVDEAIWSTAIAISDFTQQEPVEGAAPSQATEVRVTFDQDNLYIAAIIYDDPDGIMAFQKERDAFLFTDDRFMVILDTFLDGRTGYHFEINPAGAMGDGLLSGGGGRGGGMMGGFGGSNKSWDGIWEAHTARRPDGWSAEIRIPFRTLNFDPESDTWGINFQRTIRRGNEEILWRGWRRREGLFRPIYAGRLTGLSGLSQGIGLEAQTSAVANWRNQPADPDPTTYPRDVSLDVNYSVTSSLRASLSVNTDFAEVESDERRVNLTRFPQRLRELRDFFLEGSSVFSFAPRSGPSPFFSRQIGINSGQQIPIDVGARVTGQVGAFEVGFYQIATGSHDYLLSDGAPSQIQSEDFTVARVKRRIFEQSTIGAIYTRRATSADPTGFAPDDRHTAGFDVALNTRNFLGDNNLEFEGFLVWNSNPDPTEDLTFNDLSAHGFRFNFPNDIWSGHISYRQFGDDYRPAVGFVTRNDFRRVEPRIGWAPRPESIDWIRRFNFSVQFRNLTELGTGIVEEREWDFNVFSVDFESGDHISVSTKRKFEYLDNPFTLSGIEIQPGEYTMWERSARWRTSSRRKVSGGGSFTWSDFWSGERFRYDVRAGFRPSPGISFSTNFQHNQVTLPEGSFTADLYELEGQWTPTPWVSFTNQVQYDEQSEILGLFARLRWIVTPGNDIFLVYTHNWQNTVVDLGDAFDPLDRHQKEFTRLSRGAAIKAVYTYRF